jgi:hypothetical protein
VSAADWLELSLEDTRNPRARGNRPFGMAPWNPQRETRRLLEAVLAVRDNEKAMAAADGRDWLGLGPRQYAYRVKATGFTYANGTIFDKDHFARVETVLARARRVGQVDWEDVSDGRGTAHEPYAYRDNDQRLDTLAYWAGDLSHDRLAGQDYVPELFVETEGLYNLVYDLADRYGVRAMTAGGQSSIDLRYRLAERVRARADRLRVTTVVLAFVDYDEAGDHIVGAVAKDAGAHLRATGHEDWLEVVQVALTPALIARLGIPTVTKTTASGAIRLIQEVEAVPTGTLRQELQDAIEHYLDMDAFTELAEQRQPEVDRLVYRLQQLKGRVP